MDGNSSRIHEHQGLKHAEDPRRVGSSLPMGLLTQTLGGWVSQVGGAGVAHVTSSLQG